MSFSHRFFLYGPFALFLALVIGVSLYWWQGATRLSARLDALNGHAVAPGVTVHFGSKRIAGFPFRLDAIFGDFTLQIPGAHGPVTWHAERFATHRLTYASDVTVLEASGREDLDWTDDDGAHRHVAFTPGLLRASAVIDDDRLRRFDLDAVALASDRFAASRAQFHLRHDPVYDALDIVAELQGVRFAGDEAAGFANGISFARVEGRLAPGTPFAALLDGRGDWKSVVETWRRQQGGFKVDEAAILWDKCQATSSGAVALDDDHRLAGSLSFSLAHCGALAQQASRVTQKPRAHRAIVTALADLASRETPARNGAIPVTLVFKDGLVYVGPGKTLATGGYFEPVGFLHALY